MRRHKRENQILKGLITAAALMPANPVPRPAPIPAIKQIRNVNIFPPPEILIVDRKETLSRRGEDARKTKIRRKSAVLAHCSILKYNILNIWKNLLNFANAD